MASTRWASMSRRAAPAARDHALAECRGARRRLRAPYLGSVGEHHIGECAADIDANAIRVLHCNQLVRLLALKSGNAFSIRNDSTGMGVRVSSASACARWRSLLAMATMPAFPVV